MSALGIHASSDREVPPGTVTVILPHQVDRYWPAFAGILKSVEGWTQCMAADDIHPRLRDGRMQLWNLLGPDDKSVFALTAIVGSARGPICTAWLIATQHADDANVAALIDRCEAVARMEGCAVLEIKALPGFVNRIVGKITAVVIERDIRLAPTEVN